MKLVIHIVICLDCKGEGYKPEAYLVGHTLNPVNIMCKKCKGTGIESASIERENIAWEKE